MENERIIIISHMFPNNLNKVSGIFVKEQVRALKESINNEIIVISPVPYSPRVLWFRKKWREYGKVWLENYDDGIKVIYPRYIAIPGAQLFFLQGFAMFITLFFVLKELVNKKERFIIHCHTIMPDGLAVALLRKYFSGMKSVCTIHGSDINIYPFRTKLTMKYTKYALLKHDQIITVSNALKEKTLKICSAVQGNINVVTNGVNLNRFNKRAPETKEIATNPEIFYETEAKYILFVGNLLKAKGVFELLEAFKAISQDNEGIRLIFVGDGPECENLKTICEEDGLQDRVHFAGRVSHEEVNLFMNRSDVFVLPSYSEGMPTVMFEAMACALPIIISDVGGVSEIIEDGKNGLIIKPGVPEEIVTALKKVLDNYEYAHSIGRFAYDTVQNYTWEENAKYTSVIFRRLEFSGISD